MIKNIVIYGAIVIAALVFYVIITNPSVNNKTTMTKKPSAEKYPFPLIDSKKQYAAVLDTTDGAITIQLDPVKTPVTVSNFVYLAKKNFYNNTIFHRVIKGFMIQGGDPKGDGTGGPGYKFKDEPISGDYTRGTVAMANSGPNTNGSQFFIMQENNQLPKNYVIFGKVSAGMDVVDKIADAPVKANSQGENSSPVNPVTVKSVTISEK
ncbi:peptidylprolyl isomerase [Patescibacteria group bacterium]|nr:peptidylprolyl isomerase [Patescibacteria group bacterium]